MSKRRNHTPPKRPFSNRRPAAGLSFWEKIGSLNQRAHEKANRRSGKRQLKTVQATITATDMGDSDEGVALVNRMVRWLLGLVLLPLCWVTTWTFLSRFSHATMEQGFWQAAEFWYFSIGGLVMIGWFWSGLWERFFLYVYVLGHELTHAAFVVMFRGKVTDIHVSPDGGYITTNKTNVVISLSPYFVPFWALIFAVLYVSLGAFVEMTPNWDLAFYGVMGLTWMFHMVWTLWMIPRDQPDLKENGTFLSLVLIYLGNLVVLVALMCVADQAPLKSIRDFAMEWLRHTATWSDAALRWTIQALADFRAAAKF